MAQLIGLPNNIGLYNNTNLLYNPMQGDYKCVK